MIRICAQNIVDTARDLLLSLDASAGFRSDNRAFHRNFWVAPTEPEGPLISL